jgi:hypothetical protein
MSLVRDLGEDVVRSGVEVVEASCVLRDWWLIFPSDDGAVLE